MSPIIITQMNPVAFSLFGFDVRWYALAYIAGFILGYFLFRKLMRADGAGVSLDKRQLDDLLTWIIFGVVIGGRLGYVLFYNLPFFISHPLAILAVWQGGMSFHGGLLGVIVATFLFAHHTGKNGWAILDLLAVVAPIGLFFGRIANFVNMELIGRPTTVPWAVQFVDDNGNVLIPASHPSPIYEALTEGLILFILMYCLFRFTNIRKKPGALSGVMGMGYAVSRILCEGFRTPDVQLGFIWGDWLTMGMLLSLLMFFAGLGIFVFAIRKK